MIFWSIPDSFEVFVLNNTTIHVVITPLTSNYFQELFMQGLQSVGFCAQSLHDQLKVRQNYCCVTFKG